VTLAANDPVLLSRTAARWIVLGRLGATTPTSQPIGSQSSPDGAVEASGRLAVAPVETRSWTGAAWRSDTDDVRQGEYGGATNHTGCAFYGTSLAGLAGATVTAARVHVRRISGGSLAAQTTTLWTVTEATRPVGAPSLVDSATGPALAVGDWTVFTIPTGWAQDLADGVVGGLGLCSASGTPYVRTAGQSVWGPAWTLVIDWAR
jgi:hypothetical protein